ncbi:MAG: hypothetical protein ACREA9_12635 [Pyrinomonadaceae bacterium]
MKIYTNTRRVVRRWLLRKTQPCRQMVPLMSESMDRRLGVLEYLKLKLHLLVCVWCARYLKQIKLLGSVLRLPLPLDEPTSEPAVSLPPEARERIAKALNRDEVISTTSR